MHKRINQPELGKDLPTVYKNIDLYLEARKARKICRANGN